jgi:hypothetical protein
LGADQNLEKIKRTAAGDPPRRPGSLEMKRALLMMCIIHSLFKIT